MAFKILHIPSAKFVLEEIREEEILGSIVAYDFWTRPFKCLTYEEATNSILTRTIFVDFNEDDFIIADGWHCYTKANVIPLHELMVIEED